MTSETTGSPADIRPIHWAVLGLVVLAGALVCALSVAAEAGFYHWDFAFYEDKTREVADAFWRSPVGGARLVLGSLRDDYNLLFTLPLAPWVAVLGEHRLAFILAVYFTFFVPYLLLVAAVAARLAPGRRGAAACVAAGLTLATPACWYHLLGYPDVAGAALMAGCVLLYGRWTRRGGYVAPVLLGALAGLAVLLRRHFAYALMALFVGLLADAALRAVAARRTAAEAGSLRRQLAALGVAAGATVIVIGVPMPGFFGKALGGSAAFAPWQQSMGGTLWSTVATVGVVPLLVAGAGWVWSWRSASRSSPELRVTLMATLVWLGLWVGHARQQPYHYPHWLPLAVIVGLTACWVRAGGLEGSVRRRLVRGGMMGLAAVTWALTLPLGTFDPPDTTPLRLLPDRVPRIVNPARAQVADLALYLHGRTRPGDQVLVVAASHLLNRDVVIDAERRIFGRRGARLDVLPMPVVDDPEVGVLGLLVGADLVVVGEPVQTHLGPEHQKSIRALADAFRGRWPIAEDFEAEPRRFPLPDAGGEIRVYHRRRPTAREIAADAGRRIDRLLGRPAPGDSWWLVSSPLPSAVTLGADGAARVQVHPARGSAPRSTRVVLAGFGGERARLAGKVHFLDARCRGIAIVAVVGEGGASERSEVGVFSPAANDAPLAADFPRLGPRPLGLEVRGLPAHPEQIDHCTVVLTGLRADPLPGTSQPAR